MAEHNSLTGTSVHECKQISSAGTSDAGKVITPSSSTAGEGTLRLLTESEISSKVCYITTTFEDVSTAATTIYIPMAFAGTITGIRSVLHGTIATADVTLTCSVNTTAITDGALTIAYSGSAAGDIDTATPSANNTFTAGDYIKVASDGASTNAVNATLMFTITRA